VPCSISVGVALEIRVGADISIIKLVGTVMVTPFTVIAIGPVVAPAGTEVVIVVEVDAVTVAAVPLNVTILLEGVVLKFVPFNVTVVPILPNAGLKSVKVGVGNTVNADALVNVTPLTFTVIIPVVAPGGTVVVMVLVVDSLTTAVVPLKETILSPGLVLKFVPEIITVAPTAALIGLKLVIAGVGRTVKVEALVNVTPLVVTEMVPVVAPEGTVVVMVVEVDALTTAVVPLKETTLFAGEVLKLVPVIVTVAPTAPEAGLNPDSVGEPGTVKLDELVKVTPLVVTVIGPVAAPTGTVVVMVVAFEEETIAVTPLNFTIGLLSKFVPAIVTVAPTAALVGLKLVIVGVGRTVNVEALVNVSPLD
jgi:hypothetical protein